MKTFQLVSDLHLEFLSGDELPILERHADNLILAGDIGYPTRGSFVKFMNQVCVQFERVFYVPGNHEYYCGLPKSAVDDLLRRQSEEIGFHLLNNSSFDLGGLTIIGSTMWTETSPKNSFILHRYIRDYRKIKFDDTRLVTPAMTGSWHKEAVDFLRAQFKIPGDKLVITHHLPSLELIHERYRGSPVNCGFASSLDDMFEGSGVKVWCAGHTHSQIVKKLGSIQFYVNPVGYPGENPDPDTSFHFAMGGDV